MRLSTSSFDVGAVPAASAKILLAGLLAGVLLVLVLENFLRYKGLQKNVRDSAGLWASQRAKATQLGKDDFILVGNSRIQLGIDIAIIEAITHKKVVQLAIDGEPLLPVLVDLANDNSIKGTVIIGGGLENFVPSKSTRAIQWIDNYHRNYQGLWMPAKEEYLSALVQSFSVLYASIIPPIELAKLLIMVDRFPANYLKTLPNRGRNADYSLVPMPDFYIARVLRNLGQSLEEKDFKDYETFSNAVIQRLEKHTSPYSTDKNRFLVMDDAIKKLHYRGVKVYIVNFPVSGLIEEIDNRRYPKQAWDEIINYFNVVSIDYRDYPNLQFILADGSHLDYVQKQYFTARLIEIMQTKAGPENN